VRNVLSVIPKGSAETVAATIRTVFARPAAESIRTQLEPGDRTPRRRLPGIPEHRYGKRQSENIYRLCHVRGPANVEPPAGVFREHAQLVFGSVHDFDVLARDVEVASTGVELSGGPDVQCPLVGLRTGRWGLLQLPGLCG
jgi:hypothetical protein